MEIRLPARLENLGELVRFVSESAGDCGFDPGRILQIELAAEESLMNIFSHAYPDETSGNVVVSCRAEGQKEFWVTFTDWGIPFDMRTYRSKDLLKTVEERDIGGVGIVLIRKMADEIEYRRETDQNILTLIFHRS